MRLVDAITGYRYPVMAIVSILHRASGVIMFVLMPFIIWMFDASVSSEISYGQFTSVFAAGVGFLPGWFFKLIALALIWSYLQHFIAGLRHLLDRREPGADAGARHQAVLLLRPSMEQNFGSKRTVVGAHYGLRDWLSQRITAAVMALFTIVLLLQVLFGAEMGYDRWAGIFSSQWMKVLTFVVIVSLLVHAWVGMRDVWMDYVRPVGARLLFQVVTIVWLVGCAGWAIQVLWRL